jgi:predicted DNA-binding ribbon-helix-helix protein
MAKPVSPVRKRSVSLNGHKTSFSLESEFWDGLKEIADFQNVPLFELASKIDQDRGSGNLSSALRLYVLTGGVRLSSRSDSGNHSCRSR